MLNRLYKLKEVVIFHNFRKKKNLLKNSQGFQQLLAYLVNIFQALNALNFQHQGKKSICFMTVYRSGVRSKHASHALHDQIFRNCITNFCVVDIVELEEKYYLFRIKCEAYLRRKPIFLCYEYFREYCEFRAKSKKSETG